MQKENLNGEHNLLSILSVLHVPVLYLQKL